MNEIDNEGLSPLHLAAAAKSYRIVRHLLMRGASRDIKNKTGFTPLQFALQNGASEQIKEILTNPICLENINPIKPPIQPVTNSYTAFILYIFTFVARYVFIFLYLIPNIDY